MSVVRVCCYADGVKMILLDITQEEPENTKDGSGSESDDKDISNLNGVVDGCDAKV